MSELKRRIYVVLVAVAIGVWALNSFQRQESPETSSAPPKPVAQPRSAPPTHVAPELTSVKQKPWGADPFFHRRTRASASRPSATTARRSKVYKLKAIVYNETAPSAFLNGRVVRPGDVIDGARVVRISKRAVTLEENGRKITVKVKRG